MVTAYPISSYSLLQPAQAGPASLQSFKLFPGQGDLERVFAELNLPALALSLEPVRSAPLGRPRRGRSRAASGQRQPAPMGRPRYSRMPFLRAFFLARAKGCDSIAELVRELRLNKAFAYFCGFMAVDDDGGVVIRIPHRSTFSRVFAEVCRVVPMLESQIRRIVREYASLVEGFGEDLVVDASVVPTNSNPNKRPKSGRSRYTDPEAGIAVKNSPRSLAGKEKLLGYSCHLAVDAKTGCLLDLKLTPGGVHESKLLVGAVDRLLERYPHLPFRSLIADRGYDSKLNSEMLDKLGISPVIHKRRPRGGGLHDGIYTTEGTPTCIGGQAMVFAGTDPGTRQRLYRCPPGGCHLKDRVLFSRFCDSEVWVNPEDDIRLFGGALRRDGPEWRAKYRMRWTVERVFSEWKREGRIERHYFRGEVKVKTLVILQGMFSAAKVLSRVRQGEVAGLHRGMWPVK